MVVVVFCRGYERYLLGLLESNPVVSDMKPKHFLEILNEVYDTKNSRKMSKISIETRLKYMESIDISSLQKSNIRGL